MLYDRVSFSVGFKDRSGNWDSGTGTGTGTTEHGNGPLNH